MRENLPPGRDLQIGDLLIDEYETSVVIGETCVFGFWLNIECEWRWFEGRENESARAGRRIVR